MSSLWRIWVLASNTYREAVRDKLLYNLLLFAALMIASSILLAQIQIGKDDRVYRDVGLSAIAFFGVLIAFGAITASPSSLTKNCVAPLNSGRYCPSGPP